MRLLLISGSFREDSTNTAVLRTVAAMAPEGVETELYADAHRLPHFNPDDDVEARHPHPSPSSAPGSTRSTPCSSRRPSTRAPCPERSRTCSSGPSGTGLYRKPVAWINAAGVAAPTGGADTHDSLRKVLGYVHADVIEAACAGIPIARQMISDDGLVHDAAVAEVVTRVVTTLTRGHLSNGVKVANNASSNAG